MARRSSALLASLAAVLIITACAQPEKLQMQDGQVGRTWHGRVALRVESDPTQSLSAALDLSGDARTGELILSSPLGTTLLVLSWRPGRATLRRDGQLRQYDSVPELMQDALGADLPLTALFAWLSGDNAVVAGWQADLSQLSNGRLSARRSEPAPVVELRLMLEP